MKSRVGIAVCLLVLSSCIRQHSIVIEEPEHLIPKDKMLNLMTEMTLLEANYQAKYVQVTRYSWLLKQDADSLFKVHNVTSEAYEQSVDYYNKHQEEMLSMYKEVRQRLEKMHTEEGKKLN